MLSGDCQLLACMQGHSNSASYYDRSLVQYTMWTMLNTATVILIEEPTSVNADLYVTLVRQTEPMGKKPRYSLAGR